MIVTDITCYLYLRTRKCPSLDIEADTLHLQNISTHKWKRKKKKKKKTIQPRYEN